MLVNHTAVLKAFFFVTLTLRVQTDVFSCYWVVFHPQTGINFMLLAILKVINLFMCHGTETNLCYTVKSMEIVIA